MTARPRDRIGASGTLSEAWQRPHPASMYAAGVMGGPASGAVPCASSVEVAGPCPPWQDVQPNWSNAPGVWAVCTWMRSGSATPFIKGSVTPR